MTYYIYIVRMCCMGILAAEWRALFSLIGARIRFATPLRCRCSPEQRTGPLESEKIKPDPARIRCSPRRRQPTRGVRGLGRTLLLTGDLGRRACCSNTHEPVGGRRSRLEVRSHSSADEEHYWTVTSSGRKFLYNAKGLADVISILVKYYVPLAHINKVTKLLKSAMERILLRKSHSVAVSRLRLPLETLDNFVNMRQWHVIFYQ